MKKKSALKIVTGIALMVSLFIGKNIHAQIPNAGFETWMSPSYGDIPATWLTLNALKDYSLGPISVFKVSDAHSGAYACKIVTGKYNSAVMTMASLQDTIGLCALGLVKAITSIPSSISYTSTPTHLDFYAKYTPSGIDTAWVFTLLQKRNGASADTIAYAAWPITTYSMYTLQHVPLIYNPAFTGVNPDTASIIISSSGQLKPQVGSELYVDDFTFIESTASIQDSKDNAVAVYLSPNPAVNELNFTFISTSAKTLEIINITGEIVETIKIAGKQYITLNTRSYPAGNYFYKLATDKNIISRGKFIVTK